MRILFLIDYGPKSGFGHINRSLILASRFKQLGLTVRYLLSELKLPEGSFNEFRGYPYSDRPFLIEEPNGEAFFDLDYLYYLFGQWDPHAIVIDSYTISRDDIIRISRIKNTIIFERPDLDGYCDAMIDFMPNSQRSTSVSQNKTQYFQGPGFFISRSTDLEITNKSGVIMHTGGSFRYDKNPVFFRTCAAFFRSELIDVSWLVINPEDKTRLLNSGLAALSDSFVVFDPCISDLWSSFVYVVGPPSSSLFESLIQKCISITACTSDPQNDDREQWVKIGHLLHVNRKVCQDARQIRKYCEIALEFRGELLGFIERVPDRPNSNGCNLLARAIIDNVLTNTTGKQNAEQAVEHNSRLIVSCTDADIGDFLMARNRKSNRLVSTSARVIDWTEHIRWWLLPGVSRFKLVKGNTAVAYIWFRQKTIDGTNYLYGGWFPSGNSADLIDALEIVKWQVNVISPRYQGSRWIATFARSNKVIPVLNKRMGFTEASTSGRHAASILFPGTDESQLVMEYSI